MSFFFVCWHSRRWWPPIRGRILQMLVLWSEKLNQLDFFCKNCIIYAWGGPRSIEMGKKHGTPPKITGFLSLAWYVAATNRDNMILAWNVVAIKPSQMEVAPLHRTVVISHKRRLFKNTKGIHKRCKRDSRASIVGCRTSTFAPSARRLLLMC